MLTQKGIKSILRQTDRNRSVFSILTVITFLLLIIFIPFTMAEAVPVDSVSISSTKLNYDTDPGSWNLDSSISFSNVDKLTLKLDLKTISKTDYDYIDTVFVIDNSESMEFEKFSYVKSACFELIDKLYSQSSNNKTALITFNSIANIEQTFISDKSSIKDVINDISFSAGTNYYQAFLKIDELLSNYKKESDRELLVLFVTDGVANEDIPNEGPSYEMLKQKYPYANVHIVQYEMGNKVNQNIALVSDRQFVSNKDSISTELDKASVVSMTYDTFNIKSYVNTNYFEVLNYSSTLGTLSFNKDTLTWNLDNNIRTLEEVEAKIELTLKDEYVDSEIVVPVLTKNIINYNLDNISETIDSSLSPVISNYNSVIYDMNLPSECTINFPVTKKYRVFDSVEIYDEDVVCGNYQLKGFSIKNNGAKLTDSNHFTMPNKTVELVAKWGGLSLSKRMDGKVSKVQTLYSLLADSAVMDNIKSEFVSSAGGISIKGGSSDTNGKGLYEVATTKNDTYPIYYFRGDVKNNNVKFAGFCWKIVRTTENGGVKLIYNGEVDSSGYCTNTTGVNTRIASSQFNSNYASAGSVGYMYGTLHELTNKRLNLYYANGMQKKQKSNIPNTKYYFSDTVTYSNGVYTLVNPVQYLYKENYSNLDKKYTCLSETETSCTNVGQVYLATSGSTYLNYYEFTDGLTYEFLYADGDNHKWIFGNDFTYSNGVYTLKDTISINMGDYLTDGSKIYNKHNYTCLSESNSCSTLYYILKHKKTNNTVDDNTGYYSMTGGKGIEDLKNEMFENKNDSTIKSVVDNWYKNNLLDYTKYLEDANWCSDRTISDSSLLSKDTDASNDSYTHFIGYYRLYYGSYKLSFICANSNDILNTSIEGFKYPVALLTLDEYIYAGGSNSANSSYYLYTGMTDWMLTPRSYYGHNASVSYVTSMGIVGGDSSNYDVRDNYGVRPAIVLKSGIRTDGGNGTMEDPYLITKDVNKNVIG